MSIFEKGQNLLEKIKIPASRIPFKTLGPYFVAGLIGYAAADLTLLSFRPGMLPSEAPPVRPQKTERRRMKSLADYNVITSRNIFNEDGKIPPALSSDGSEGGNTEMEAVPSQLPLTLMGTIVHFNPKRSIATIQLNGKNVTMSYVPDEEIENMAKITKVERKKVTFMNLNNRRMEYIEIPENAAFNFEIKKGNTAATGPVEQQGKFDFSVKRSEVERLTSNLSQVLQQARMEPRFGPDGMIDGFCFVNMQGGSIYETLGFRIGDCIEQVNGQPVNSPAKAFEMFQKLRSASNIQLGVERDGRSEDFKYTIQ